MLLQKFILKLRCYWVASETIFGSLFVGQMTVSHVWISRLSAHCVIQYWFQLSDRLFILQTTPFASFGASFNMSPACLWALCGCLLSNANCWHQANHEWGKKWFGWNWTNRTGSYDPVVPCVFQHLKLEAKHITLLVYTSNDSYSVVEGYPLGTRSYPLN